MNNILNSIPSPSINNYYRQNICNTLSNNYIPTIIKRFLGFDLLEYVLLKIGILGGKWIIFIVIAVIV